MRQDNFTDKTKWRKFVVDNVATIASREFHDCYCLAAIRLKKYSVGPEESFGGYQLNDKLIENLIEHSVVTKKEGEAIRKFNRIYADIARVIKYPSSEKANDFFDNDINWKRIQDKARSTLLELKINLVDWEKENIKWASIGMERPEKYRRQDGKS